MILRLGEKECDDSGGREEADEEAMSMDWEAGGPGYYARAADDNDWSHPYREQNMLLRNLAHERMTGAQFGAPNTNNGHNVRDK